MRELMLAAIVLILFFGFWDLIGATRGIEDALRGCPTRPFPPL